MAGSVNKVILVGNLGKDPEIRTLTSGDRVCNLTLATSESWRDRTSGEKKEKTEWHRIVIFNDNLVKVAESYLKKGSTIYIEGQLSTRKWTDNSGVEQYSTEVVLQKFRGEIVMLDGASGVDRPPPVGPTISSSIPLCGSCPNPCVECPRRAPPRFRPAPCTRTA